MVSAYTGLNSDWGKLERKGGRGETANPLVVHGPGKPQFLLPSLMHMHSCKHLCSVHSPSRHDSGHWILINCSAAESEHSSENIWQALFIDLTGGWEESTATRSGLFWSSGLQQKLPWWAGAAKPQGHGAQLDHAEERGFFFFFLKNGCGEWGKAYKWKRHVWLLKPKHE